MAATPKRPLVLTGFCIVVALALVFRASVALWAADSFGPIRLTYILIHKLVFAAAIAGLWQMRRWGLYLYVAGYAISTALYFVLTRPHWSYHFSC